MLYDERNVTNIYSVLNIRRHKLEQIANYKLMNKLRIFLFISHRIKSLTIMQVTQINMGTVITKVDCITQFQKKEGFKIFEDLKNLKKYNHHPLKISSIKDRITQFLVNYRIEPFY